MASVIILPFYIKHIYIGMYSYLYNQNLNGLYILLRNEVEMLITNYLIMIYYLAGRFAFFSLL